MATDYNRRYLCLGHAVNNAEVVAGFVDIDHYFGCYPPVKAVDVYDLEDTVLRCIDQNLQE